MSNGNADFYLKTNDSSYKEIKELADKHKITMEELFSGEIYDDEVIDILYPKLPKMIKMFTSKNVFKNGYVKKRQYFVQQFRILEQNSK